jgi:hypothetical protein
MSLSKRHHTPLTGTPGLSHTVLNAVFSDLDSAIESGVVQGVAGEALSERDFVYLDESAGDWNKLDTDASSPILAGRLLGCVTESGGISSSATGGITAGGLVTGFTGLSVGVVYASTTAGGYTQTRPAVTDGGAQVAICVLGFAISSTDLIFAPAPIWYAKRETLADDATLTIEHHSDPQSRERRVAVYVDDTFDEPLFVGSYSGSSSEFGVRFDDGAGSDADTKTTFINRTGASADAVCVVRL